MTPERFRSPAWRVRDPLTAERNVPRYRAPLRRRPVLTIPQKRGRNIMDFLPACVAFVFGFVCCLWIFRPFKDERKEP